MLAVAVLAQSAGADLRFSAVPDLGVEPAAIFADHAVLRRAANTPVFGFAPSGAKVSVSIGGASAEGVADARGRWLVRLDLRKVGAGPHELTVNGWSAKDVLVGEVWLCSGQSNMELTMACVDDAAAENRITNELIRCFHVQRGTAEKPCERIRGAWLRNAPGETMEMTAVGYHFAKCLQRALGTPVGIVDSSFGASTLEAWCDPVTFTHPAGRRFLDRQVAFAKEKKPSLPQRYPIGLHNAMIAGLVPYGLSGVVWYQGESNAAVNGDSSGPDAYADLFRGFIPSWRALFGNPELPFAWCQLAGYMAKAKDPNGTDLGWVRVRAAQQSALELPMTGQAVLIDVGEELDIHPRDKRTPGQRLAAWALNRVYGRDVPCRGPHVAGVVVEGGTAVVAFADAAGGLVAKDLGRTYVRKTSTGATGKVVRNSPEAQVEGFSVCGEDGVWHWADRAEIEGDKVRVSAKDVPRPVAVRYGWAKNPWVNLYNSDGFPAEPFERDRARAVLGDWRSN